MVSSSKPRVAFVGTGLMGYPMAGRLLQAGYPLIAYNRTLVKAEPLRAFGGEVVSQPEEAVQAAEYVLLMLSDADAIHKVMFSSSVKKTIEGKSVIQLGTISSNESRMIQGLIEGAGGEYLEAPVLGNPTGAKEGTLIVMVGGTNAQYDRFLPLLRVIGSNVYFVGAVGKAAALKLALNQMIGSLVTAFSLSLGIVLREQLPVEPFMEILRQSSYYAPTFDKKLSWMLERNFAATNFPIRLMLKDVHLILDQASDLGLRTEALEGVQQILTAAVDAGWGENDYSAVYNAVNPEN